MSKSPKINQSRILKSYGGEKNVIFSETYSTLKKTKDQREISRDSYFISKSPKTTKNAQSIASYFLNYYFSKVYKNTLSSYV